MYNIWQDARIQSQVAETGARCATKHPWILQDPLTGAHNSEFETPTQPKYEVGGNPADDSKVRCGHFSANLLSTRLYLRLPTQPKYELGDNSSDDSKRWDVVFFQLTFYQLEYIWDSHSTQVWIRRQPFWWLQGDMWAFFCKLLTGRVYWRLILLPEEFQRNYIGFFLTSCNTFWL